jgi:hypothetical protein
MKNHYLVINAPDGEKKMLVQCTAVSDSGKLKVRVPEKEDVENFIIKQKEVVADLGKTPAPGSVYGLKIEPLIETKNSDFWGEIRIYRWLEDEHKTLIFNSLKRTRKEIQRRKLPNPTVDLEIRSQKGKMAGYYKHLRNAEKDVLVLLALDDSDSVMDYIVSHEYAHGIWFRHMTPKARMRWVKHYHESLKVEELKEKQLQQLLEAVNAEGSFGPFLKSDSEDRLAIKAILRNISQVHALSKQHLELALTVGEGLDQYWPTSIEISEKDVLITEYAKKNPEELWAEAFSYHFVGKKIPKLTAELLDKTLRNLIR